MWSVVFTAASFFAITFAVVFYSMREIRRRERRVVYGLPPSAFLRNPD
jgi:hypothetical protein